MRSRCCVWSMPSRSSTTSKRCTPTSTSRRRSWPRLADSKRYWDEAARRDAEWHVATQTAHDRDLFFRLGASDTDSLLAFCGLEPSPHLSVLEIGCGVGRMTHRLADLYGRVVALDVSAEMLERCRENLAGRDNVEFVEGSGEDLNGVADASVDHVFSYITLQHIPSAVTVRRYLSEVVRVLK